MRVALRLGKFPYEVERLGSAELSRFIAFWTHVDPFPEPALDAAVVASVTAKSFGGGDVPFETFVRGPADPIEVRREETLEESAARLLAGFGRMIPVAKDDGKRTPPASA